MSVVAAFDGLVAHLATARASFTELEVLGSLWAQGEEGWLREDARFRPTAWGRWILSDRYLANDLLVRTLRRERVSELSLSAQLIVLDKVTGLMTACCPADPRLHFEGDSVRLAPSELTAAPLVEEAPTAGPFTTHLPLLTLKAAAASLPAGEWGSGAAAQAVEPLGWLRVHLSGERLNRRMFVAQVRGHSMDDGRSGLVDGALAVFEYSFFQGTHYAPATAKPVVLVRGQLSDPDTGSYAVKQWQAGEGGIRLTSLNPDRDRFPDIVIGDDEATEVRVIATLVRALRPSEYGRTPAPERVPGRRDLRSPGALEALRSRLNARLDRFFDGQPGGEEGEEELPVAWSARLVCLEGAAGGVAIEVGPLVGLPPFVRRLCLSGQGWSSVHLASNARHQPLSVSVPPGSGPWSWSVVDFEDDPDADLSALGLDAMNDAHPTVFRVDASGVGRQMTGGKVGPDGVWRLIVPPALTAHAAEHGSVEPLAGGWGLFTLSDGAWAGAAVTALLERLGLDVGEPAPCLRWAPTAPTEWRSTPAGHPYACFLTQHPMSLGVTGLSDGLDGDAVLLLTGAEDQGSLPLPAADRSWLQLQMDKPGRYLVTLMHTRSAVAPVSLAFEVLAAPSPLPAATWSARLGEEVLTGSAGEVVRAPTQDLAALGTSAATLLSVTAPPGWPVRARWRGLHVEHLAINHAERDGSLDVDHLLSITAGRRSRLPLGDLILDLGELGALVLPHERRLSTQDLHRAAVELVRTRGAGLARLRGDLLWTVWLEPITRLLGYETSPLELMSCAEPSEAASARTLVSLERDGDEVRPEPVRLLVVVEDATAQLSDAMLGWIDALCREARVQRAVITDGAHFRAHERRSRLVRAPLDLFAATGSQERFQAFLEHFAVGV